MPKKRKKSVTGKTWAETGALMKSVANSGIAILSPYVKCVTIHSAVMAVYGNKIKKTNSGDACLDEYEQAIRHHTRLRLKGDLDETIPVLTFELFKEDENGEELKKNERGLMIEGKLHRIFIGFVGFGKDHTYKDLEEIQPMIRILMESFIKNHWLKEK
ncbi:MAG: hypothetical protein LBL08_01540 [Candidatus Nomurabacteria bacterium]|jgi:hypothetical protein|nr:hypothetical protein [Candidatus Nomurabacteria bacterium]